MASDLSSGEAGRAVFRMCCCDVTLSFQYQEGVFDKLVVERDTLCGFGAVRLVFAVGGMYPLGHSVPSLADRSMAV